MNWPILALYLRSLRLESRRPLTYVVRLVLGGSIMVSLMMAAATSAFTSNPGREFFAGVMYIDLVFVTLAAISYFSSAIAEEKEEMTLGLLRMTGLNHVAILLGKSTSRLTGALLLLLAQVPFTVLAVTLGGISLGQIASAYVCLTAYTLFVCNLALFGSVVCDRTTSAGSLTLLALVGFFAGPPLALVLLEEFHWDGGVLEALAQLAIKADPFVAMTAALGYSGGIEDVVIQTASNLALAALFFLVSWWCFDWATREMKEAGPSRGMVARRTSRLRFAAAGRAFTGSRALMWKDFHFMAGGKVGLALRALALALAGVGYGFLMRRSYEAAEMWGVAMMITAAVLFYLELVFQAARVFNTEAFADGEGGTTLPMLLMLPITTPRLMAQKLMGCCSSALVYVPFFLIGGAANPQGLGELVEAVAGNPAAWIQFLYGALFLLMVAYFSLVVKRGAVLLAAGVSVVAFPIGGMFFTLTMFFIPGGLHNGRMFLSQFTAFATHALVLGGIGAALVTGIVRRLRMAAGR